MKTLVTCPPLSPRIRFHCPIANKISLTSISFSNCSTPPATLSITCFDHPAQITIESNTRRIPVTNECLPLVPPTLPQSLSHTLIIYRLSTLYDGINFVISTDDDEGHGQRQKATHQVTFHQTHTTDNVKGSDIAFHLKVERRREIKPFKLTLFPAFIKIYPLLRPGRHTLDQLMG